MFYYRPPRRRPRPWLTDSGDFAVGRELLQVLVDGVDGLVDLVHPVLEKGDGGPTTSGGEGKGGGKKNFNRLVL